MSDLAGPVLAHDGLLVEVGAGAGCAGALPALVWRAGPGWRMAATTVLGGGLGERGWVLNVQVPHGYAREDPQAHLRELAVGLGLPGAGVGMLTAARVAAATTAADGRVEVIATVGLGRPTWAAAPEEPETWRGRAAVVRPGTINLLVVVPVPLDDGAMLNAIATTTEAKTQALLEHGWACTGTASDAVCIAAPMLREHAARSAGAAEPFAGPRSRWGARIARAVHAAVRAGAGQASQAP